MTIATADATKRTRRGKVMIERDRQLVLAAKLLAGRAVMDVTWPALMARVHSSALGTDIPVAADEGIKMPGTPIGNGWLTMTAQEHRCSLIVLDAHLVRHVVENGMPLKQLATSLKQVAADTGADVLLVDDTQPQPAPAPSPALPAIGEKVGSFAIGNVREVPSASLHALRSELDTLGRGAAIVSYAGPDRLIAQRHGSVQRLEHRLFGRTAQPPAVWLRDVVLAYEPLLLIVEGEALARVDLDLDELASTHRVAIGVLPGPTDPAQTPQTRKEA